MAKPLGMIIDKNPIVGAPDVYALVLNNTVVNTIKASYNDILSIAPTYDYCVDITMNGSQNYGIGDTYDPSHDTFTPPPAPPIDWPQNVQFDFDSLISTLQQIIIDSGPGNGNLTNLQINAAYNSALNDNPGLDQPTTTLMASVLQYVLAKG